MARIPTPEPNTARATSDEAAKRILQKIRRLGMTPRQQQLNTLWAMYQCCQYDGRKIGWDGGEIVGPLEREQIAGQGYVPSGFYEAGGSFPLQFRKPTAPYNLLRVIVDRFTGLLFSERRHPKLRVENNPEAEQFATDLAEASRLWPMAILARAYGGAMGTVAMGFQFIDGKPVVEVHDPRWLFPTWKNRWELSLRKVEKRMMYPVEEQNEKGDWETVWYWYRRVIDEQNDTVFAPALVEDDEPDWQIDRQATHGYGFCPVVWVQNLPLLDDVDGVPDCHGTTDMMGAIDALLAQAHKGVLSNCDPTLVLVTDAALAQVRKGSDNALKLPQGGSANYLEINGGGPKAAQDLAEVFRKYALEVAQCVLEHPDVQNRTAYEVDRAYESMRSKADILREQYGEKGIKPLFNMMIRAAVKIAQPQIQNGQIVRQGLQPFGGNGTQMNGAPPPAAGAPNQGGRPLLGSLQLPSFAGPINVTLQWPRYFEPSLTDVQVAAGAASVAKAAGVIDQEHASKFVADFFKVEDVPEMLAKIKAEQPDLAAQSLAGMRGARPPGGPIGAGGIAPPGPAAPPPTAIPRPPPGSTV